MRWHGGYAIAAAGVLAIEIVIALFVRDRVVRPFGGDALAVVLVYLAIRAVTKWQIGTSVAAALAVAVAVEFGQWFGLVRVLGLEGNRVAETVLGTGFDRRDFLAYAVGGAGVLAVEAWRRARASG